MSDHLSWRLSRMLSDAYERRAKVFESQPPSPERDAAFRAMEKRVGAASEYLYERRMRQKIQFSPEWHRCHDAAMAKAEENLKNGKAKLVKITPEITGITGQIVKAFHDYADKENK